jgi:hypothetical protein
MLDIASELREWIREVRHSSGTHYASHSRVTALFFLQVQRWHPRIREGHSSVRESQQSHSVSLGFATAGSEKQHFQRCVAQVLMQDLLDPNQIGRQRRTPRCASSLKALADSHGPYIGYIGKMSFLIAGNHP